MSPTEKPRHALCPACGKMSCEHLAAELEQLREKVRELEALAAPRPPPAPTATDRGTLEILAAEAAGRIGVELKATLPKDVGFAVLVFDFGGKGNLAYVSNAHRGDMVRAMREFITKHEAGGVSSVFGRPNQ